jgi:hypothetical protein
MRRILIEKSNKFIGFIHSEHDIISFGYTSIVLRCIPNENYNSSFLVAYKFFKKEDGKFNYIDSQNVFLHLEGIKFLEYWKGYHVNNKTEEEINELSEKAIKLIDDCYDYKFFSSDKETIMTFNFNN